MVYHNQVELINLKSKCVNCGKEVSTIYVLEDLYLCADCYFEAYNEIMKLVIKEDLHKREFASEYKAILNKYKHFEQTAIE